MPDDLEQGTGHEPPESKGPVRRGEITLVNTGYLLIMSSVVTFFAVVMLEVLSRHDVKKYDSWLGFITGESTVVVLLAMGTVTALLGQRLLTITYAAYARTIPREDYDLISGAVKEGKADPIDQYVRLRSLTGWAGTFTKLGVTGLPLVTVFLTLVFAGVSLLTHTSELTKDFMDLAKLTLGAFIGSFVQRTVEQRKQDFAATGMKAKLLQEELPT